MRSLMHVTTRQFATTDCLDRAHSGCSQKGRRQLRPLALGALRGYRLVMRRTLTAAIVTTALACGSDPASLAAQGADAQPADAGSSDAASSDASTDAADPTIAPFPPPVPPPPPVAGHGAPYPIVLCHGMAGFSKLTAGPIGIAYFRGVVDELRKRGEREVYVTEVDPFASSEVRAAQLKPQIDRILAETGSAKVNIIGHSQGGLDARVLVSAAGLGYGGQVGSVTSIGTPHRGTRVADAALGLAGGALSSNAVSGLLAWLSRTVYDRDNDPNLRAQLATLTTQRASAFNVRYTDAAGVGYFSYAGRTNLRAGIGICDNGALPNEPLKLDATRPALTATAAYLENGFPPVVNDGLVTVESAKWGTFMGCVPADHMDQMGYENLNLAFDAPSFFADIVKRLRGAGY
jgi:triacylglycerol lipase